MTEPPPHRRRFRLGGRTLRQHAARGTLINAAFYAGLSSLGLIKGFVVAIFLTREEYGLWGIVLVGLGTLIWLRDVGIVDRYIQQDEQDQEAAFQKAFTLELIVMGIFVGLLLVLVPLYALIYDRPELIPLGVAFALVFPAGAFQTPTWVYYRRMEFARQRTLQAVDPVVAFVATVVLAAAGLGEWSLVIGLFLGAWSGALVAWRLAPYPLRLRYDRGTLREYYAFSWPLFAASASSLVIAQGSIIGGAEAVGVAGVGAIALASGISMWADRVDLIVTGTLYPAICAVRDKADLLFESFEKSNRLTLMWGMPFGVGLTLFAADLVHFGLGDEWVPAIFLMQAFGLTAAFNHIGFNWTAYFRALGRTRPMAVANTITMLVFVAVALPLMFSQGLKGFGVGMGAVCLAGLVARWWFLLDLFPGFAMAKYLLRAIAPTIPAVAFVLGLRALDDGARTLPLAFGELAAYGAITLAATVALERQLLREALDYLRGGVRRAAAPA